MSKPTKPFILEVKVSRRKRIGAVGRSTSLWSKFAPDFKPGSPANLDEQPEPVDPAPEMVVSSDLRPAAPSRGEGAIGSSSRSDFIAKWGARKAEKPRAGSRDVITTFLTRIERQKTLLAEFQADPASFTKWRSAWFRRVAGGFGVSVGHDSIDAGGFQYVIVDKADEIAEFFDDLARHAQRDASFQCVLRENHLRHAARQLRDRIC